MMVPRPEQQHATHSAIATLAKPTHERAPSHTGVRPAYLRDPAKTTKADAPQPQRTSDRQLKGGMRHPAAGAAARRGVQTASHGSGAGARLLAQHTGRHLLGETQDAAAGQPRKVPQTEEQQAPERAQPTPLPTTGPHSISREPVNVSLRSTSFDAPRTLDLTAKRAATANEGGLPPALADFRSLFAQAAEQAAALHRRLVEEAGTIAVRWGAEHQTLGDRHQDALDQNLSELDTNLDAARAELESGRDTLLGMITEQAQSV